MSHQEECIFQAQRLSELDAEIKAKDGYIKGLEDTVDNLYSIIEEYKKALEMLAYDTAYEPMGNLEKRIAFKKEHAQETIARYLQKVRQK